MVSARSMIYNFQKKRHSLFVSCFWAASATKQQRATPLQYANAASRHSPLLHIHPARHSPSSHLIRQ
jgi:hypothetical protein